MDGLCLAKDIEILASRGMKRSRMTETISALSGNFVIVDLGAADSKGFRKELGELSRAITLIELDAISTSENKNTDYFRTVKFTQAISGSRGSRVFYRRKFLQCSSFLEPDAQLVSQFGLEDFFVPIDEMQMECLTLQDVLEESKIEHPDFLKTDLEGIDFEVLRGSRDLLMRTLVVQSELRFQPIYHGEARFSDIAILFTDLGLDLISLQPEVWKYKTRHRRSQRDGRLVWANGFFFMSIPRIRNVFGQGAAQAFLKQILLARTLGFHNYAEWIYENTKSDLPPNICVEVERFLQPRFSFSSLVGSIAYALTFLPGGQKAIRLVHEKLADYARATKILRALPHVGSL